MQRPSAAQIRTALKVLTKLGERLNEHAAHSATQLPDTRLGNDYAARIGARAFEQTTHIDVVTEQLKHWREELVQERRQRVSHHV